MNAASAVRIAGSAAPIACVDIETTGGLAEHHRIVEIAVIGMRGATVEFEWQTLLDPGVPIPAWITALTGIDDAAVRGAPTFEQIAVELRERLDGRVFFAHNVRFDYGFIRREFLRAGLHWQAPHACTAKLSRRLYPAQPQHNLDSVLAAHGLECRARHRAFGDADVLRQFWQRILAQFTAEQIDAALGEIMRVPALPPQLDAGIADALPETSGVYMLHGDGDAVLYVGKANNLRERVLSHFAGAHRDPKSQRLAVQVQRVDWVETAGELGALLREAALVRRMQPVYNRRLRGAPVYSWYFPDRADSPQLVPLDWTTQSTGEVYGTFGSERDARKALDALAREHALCRKALGLENGAGSCFGWQVSRCRGACVGHEPLERHGLRARLAMASWKIAAWPFPGPIGLLERSPLGRAELLLLDQWQYLGAVPIAHDTNALTDAELRSIGCDLLATHRAAPRFDKDVYRLLRRYLLAERRPLRIVSLPVPDAPASRRCAAGQ
ncbi:MAG: exonuclease domain-containing protein [Steroidobacteraceae bacterium]|nr:exonuclease domain-containing protein [Steroidobacteraceae bacterium]MDW8260856.1 exonuclease domain-containing protein [Gammaproteobacteria bacterium]